VRNIRYSFTGLLPHILHDIWLGESLENILSMFLLFINKPKFFSHGSH